MKSAHAEVAELSEVTADGIAELILGKTRDPREQYLADIISGPFDADKLDYLGRDCHFTGIRAEVDWERITHALDIYESDGWRYLAVWRDAVPHLEQILFSKMMLYSAVYHHQKIRTLEQMVGVVFDVATARADQLAEPLFALEHISDIWRLTEADFFVLGQHDQAIADRVSAILNRRLMQRALSLNIATIMKNPTNLGQYSQFQQLFAGGPGTRDRARGLEEAVHEGLDTETRASLSRYDIRFDFPSSPNLSDDAEQCHVLVSLGDAQSLKTFFPTEDWVASYADNKLTSHVFASGDVTTRTAVADAAATVLGELYGLELDDTARRSLK